jgi:serine/threonine protein kinase
MAPECFSNEYGVSEKADVYSLGVIMWEGLTGLHPWQGFHWMAIVNQVQCSLERCL